MRLQIDSDCLPQNNRNARCVSMLCLDSGSMGHVT